MLLLDIKFDARMSCTSTVTCLLVVWGKMTMTEDKAQKQHTFASHSKGLWCINELT